MSSQARRGRIAAALLAFQRAAPCVPLNREGSTGGRSYRYADLPSIVAALRRPLADNNLAFTQVFDEGFLVTRLLHTSGEEIVSKMPTNFAGLGPQQIGSAITYLRRYSLTALLGVVVGDEDDDAAGDPDAIIAAASRGYQVLDSIH